MSGCFYIYRGVIPELLAFSSEFILAMDEQNHGHATKPEKLALGNF